MRNAVAEKARRTFLVEIARETGIDPGTYERSIDSEGRPAEQEDAAGSATEVFATRYSGG